MYVNRLLLHSKWLLLTVQSEFSSLFLHLVLHLGRTIIIMIVMYLWFCDNKDDDGDRNENFLLISADDMLRLHAVKTFGQMSFNIVN